jgi:hypothetical protein
MSCGDTVVVGASLEKPADAIAPTATAQAASQWMRRSFRFICPIMTMLLPSKIATAA